MSGLRGAGAASQSRPHAAWRVVVFDEVLLDPRLTDAETRAMAAGLAALGWNGAAPRSSLYEAPDITIPAM